MDQQLPPNSFDSLLRDLIRYFANEQVEVALAPLRKEIDLIKRGLDEWVGTRDALKITGIDRRETLQKRATMPDTLIVAKQEGNRHYYLRSSLVAYVEANPPRRYRTKRINILPPTPTA